MSMSVKMRTVWMDRSGVLDDGNHLTSRTELINLQCCDVIDQRQTQEFPVHSVGQRRRPGPGKRLRHEYNRWTDKFSIPVLHRGE